MTDELDALKAALKAAPTPEAGARARAIAQAMQNHAGFHTARSPQAQAGDARPTQDRPNGAGFLNGVRHMLQYLTRKPALAATTSVAALAVGLAFMLPGTEGLRQTAPPAAPTAAPSDTARPAAAGSAPPGAETLAPAAPAPPQGAPVAVAEPAPVDAARMAAPDAPAPMAAEPAPNADSSAGYAAGIAAPADAETAPADDARLRKEAAADMLYLEEAPAPMAAPPAPAARMAPPDAAPLPLPDTESYAHADPNPVKVTAEQPVSTFSTDVDTASWPILRSTLEMGQMPQPDQIRVEEMVNYFPYAYPAPPGDQPFATTVSVMPTPWNAHTRLVTIGLQGARPAVADRPALNLVLLVDTSGSMDDPRKLGLLRQSMALMLPELRPEDQIAIVAYAGSAGVVLEPTMAGESVKIMAALDTLTAGGATAGAAGLELAYDLAAQMGGAGQVSRVLLATDGDFNVGLSDPDGLTAYVAKKRAEGSYLSVLGFGRGNLDDAVMQALAQNGNGTAAYIDTLSEARKVLVDQLTGALFPIADDVKVQVEWNPATVAEYRLIGYETRALDRSDFNNDAVDAGDIGAGLQVTAIYEIAAPGSAGLHHDPLRYGRAPEVVAPASGELGFLRLRWKAPGDDASQLVETPITGTEPGTEDSRFAAAIAGFGQLVQGSAYLGGWGYGDAVALARDNRGPDDYGYRIAAVNLMRLAQQLAQ